MTDKKMKVESYSQGNFSIIDCPLIIPESSYLKDWIKNLYKMGYYSIFNIDIYDGDPFMTVFSCPLSCDAPYPYFVQFNGLEEGRLIFMKKWYDVTHFINNHCLMVNITLLNNLMGYLKGEERPWNQ